MIIKSMSRKTKSFTQLYNYLTREFDSTRFSRNIYSNIFNKEELLKEFYTNANYLKNSRGRVFLYHEILSLEENNLSLEKQKKILFDLAYKYLERRANNHLCFGVIHSDKKHTHLHLMISSNELESSKRKRLSKKEFRTIQKEIEIYKNSRYKDLRSSSFYQEPKDRAKSKNKEQELKNRAKRTTKDDIREELEEIIKKAQSQTHFENSIKNRGYEIYKRGKTVGVIYKDKKYRLKTLGLEDLYYRQLGELERREQRTVRREETKRERSKSRFRDSKDYSRDF